MWVTKLLISPVKKKGLFGPKMTKFSPKLAFLVNLGQAMQAYSMPCCGSVGGCGARALSRKTPIYFMVIIEFNKIKKRKEGGQSDLFVKYRSVMCQSWSKFGLLCELLP